MKLVQLALAKPSMEMHQLPSRVVIHKSSRSTHEEKTGIHEGLRGKVGRYDLIALQRQDSIRLITASKYPPLRGTRFQVGELDFLYTTGFVAELKQFHGMHTLAADDRGSRRIRQLTGNTDRRNTDADEDELERSAVRRIVTDHARIRAKSLRYCERNPQR